MIKSIFIYFYLIFCLNSCEISQLDEFFIYFIFLNLHGTQISPLNSLKILLVILRKIRRVMRYFPKIKENENKKERDKERNRVDPTHAKERVDFCAHGRSRIMGPDPGTARGATRRTPRDISLQQPPTKIFPYSPLHTTKSHLPSLLPTRVLPLVHVSLPIYIYIYF